MSSNELGDFVDRKEEEEEEDLSGEILDLEAFNQLLSMDDDNDEDCEFSRGIVQNYLQQAKTTFADMSKAFKEKDLSELSSLGHFLKGSSATIGVKKVQECCKHIQYLGKLHNINGQGSVDKDEALKLISQEMKVGMEEYKKAREFLGFFYEADFGGESDDEEDSKPNKDDASLKPTAVL